VAIAQAQLGRPYRVGPSTEGTECGGLSCDFNATDLYIPITMINMEAHPITSVIYIYGTLVVDCFHTTPATGGSDGYLELLKPITIETGPTATGPATILFVDNVGLCPSRSSGFSIQSSSVTLKDFVVLWDFVLPPVKKTGAAVEKAPVDIGHASIDLVPIPLGYGGADSKREDRHKIVLFKLLHDIKIIGLDFSGSIAHTDIRAAIEGGPEKVLLVRVAILHNTFGPECGHLQPFRNALVVGANVTTRDFDVHRNRIRGYIGVRIGGNHTTISLKYNFWCPCPYSTPTILDTRHVIVAGQPWDVDVNQRHIPLDPYQAHPHEAKPLGPYYTPHHGGVGWSSLQMALSLAPVDLHSDEAQVRKESARTIIFAF
jgi:hypothetical protein